MEVVLKNKQRTIVASLTYTEKCYLSFLNQPVINVIDNPIGFFFTTVYESRVQLISFRINSWCKKRVKKKTNKKNQQKLKLPFCCKRITKEMLDTIEICRSICMAVQTKNVLVILF